MRLNCYVYMDTKVAQAPIIVFDDADVQCAVNGVAFSAFIASGQTCVSGTRIIVQDGVYDEFMTRFLEKVESIRLHMGDRKLFSQFSIQEFCVISKFTKHAIIIVLWDPSSLLAICNVLNI